jgi:hypothetical protein
MSEQRYRLVGDNSGHDYAVPVELVEDFYEWAEDEDPEDPNKYDEYRVEGRLTFTNPRNE